MSCTSASVFAGSAPWSCEQGDAVAFLKSLPDDSVDLLVTSPPYLEARTYGTEGVSRKIGEWVPWMLDVIRAATPKVKGLIAVNCEGQTRSYAYQPAPFLLMAELYRAGFNLRKPVVFHRVGIPGSGGPDWLRNDWEPIVCVTREGRLPWSEPTACGKAPKYGPGGEMSNRGKDGSRTNTPPRSAMPGSRRRTGSGKMENQRDDALARMAKGYTLPEIANPGNIIRTPGGHVGSNLAHENEAPFPLELPTFFVLSFCPPNGVVADCFVGSGSTAHAAVNHGRRFVGCDLRQSQVDLTRRRMRGVTPSMFGGEELA